MLRWLSGERGSGLCYRKRHDQKANGPRGAVRTEAISTVRMVPVAAHHNGHTPQNAGAWMKRATSSPQPAPAQAERKKTRADAEFLRRRWDVPGWGRGGAPGRCPGNVSPALRRERADRAGAVAGRKHWENAHTHKAR